MKHSAPEEIQANVAKWLSTGQLLINLAIVSAASLFGGYAEFLAHVRHGNGWQVGTVLSFVSIAALTMAALTKSKIAWAIYFAQLIVGLAQFMAPPSWAALPNALLSLSSGVAAYAAANMLSFSLESQQQDKSDDREHELKSKEMELKHAEKMERIKQKSGPPSDSPKPDSYTDSELWTMNKNGESLKEIARRTGVPYSTVRRRVNRFESANESASEPVIYTNGTGG